MPHSIRSRKNGNAIWIKEEKTGWNLTNLMVLVEGVEPSSVGYKPTALTIELHEYIDMTRSISSVTVGLTAS